MRLGGILSFVLSTMISFLSFVRALVLLLSPVESILGFSLIWLQFIVTSNFPLMNCYLGGAWLLLGKKAKTT